MNWVAVWDVTRNITSGVGIFFLLCCAIGVGMSLFEMATDTKYKNHSCPDCGHIVKVHEDDHGCHAAVVSTTPNGVTRTYMCSCGTKRKELVEHYHTLWGKSGD
jgi:hypothetical protein